MHPTTYFLRDKIVQLHAGPSQGCNRKPWIYRAFILGEKCPNTEFFLVVFSCFRTRKKDDSLLVECHEILPAWLTDFSLELLFNFFLRFITISHGNHPSVSSWKTVRFLIFCAKVEVCEYNSSVWYIALVENFSLVNVVVEAFKGGPEKNLLSYS